MTTKKSTQKIHEGQMIWDRKWVRALWCALSVAAVVLWGRLIFGFSAQNSTESSSLSERVCYAIADEISQFRQESFTETELQRLVEQLEHPVRKSAHMSEYAFFSLLIFNMLCAFGLRGKKRFPIALLLVFAYASTDEFHQLFVAGRSGQFTDVLIDSAGGLIMLLIIAAVCRARARRRAARLQA